MAVVLDEHVQRAQQLFAVLALPLLDRPEHPAAVGGQRVVVLQRQQQLEGAEIPVGGDLLAALAVRRRTASSAQRASWKLSRSECVAAGRLAAARTSPKPRGELVADPCARARAGRLDPPRVDHRAQQPSADRHQAAAPALAPAAVRARAAALGSGRGEREHGGLLADPERAQAGLQVLRVQVPGERLGEHVPGHVALKHFVALVHQLRERALGDRDERQLVGHLEQREVALARGRHAAPRAGACGRSPCRSRGQRCRDRPAARSARAGTSGRSAACPCSAAARPLSATAWGRAAR